MDRIQNYGASLSFKSAKTKMFNDAVIEKTVADFKKKVMETKCTGDFEKDMRTYVDMQAENNKILLGIIEEAKEKTISYDCAKKQIQILNFLGI